jgi:hypothetical protein
MLGWSARSHTCLRCLYPESALTNASGWLPIHNLRILGEPDEEVTPEDIVTIVSSWWLPGPVGQYSYQFRWFRWFRWSRRSRWKQYSVQCRKSKRARQYSTVSTYAPPASLPPHCAAELPTRARHACCCSVRSQWGTCRCLLWGWEESWRATDACEAWACCATSHLICEAGVSWLWCHDVWITADA